MPMKPITGSSALAGYHYDPKAKTFEVQFTSGGVYRYTNVPQAAVRSILRAKSKGKMFHKKIKKGAYEYEKVSFDSQLWDAAQLKGKQLDREIREYLPDTRSVQHSNLMHTLSKLMMFSNDAVRDELKGVKMQKQANDPIKAKFEVQGVPVHVEWKKGETRLYKDKKSGEVKYKRHMKAHYGYIPNTKDADGEEIDVYLGDHHASPKAFVIKQLKKHDGSFDENKVMMGYPSKDAAKAAYDHHMGGCPEFFGGIHEVPVSALMALFGENGDGKEKVLKKAASPMLFGFAQELLRIGR